MQPLPRRTKFIKILTVATRSSQVNTKHQTKKI
jgi:hypothetical protein